MKTNGGFLVTKIKQLGDLQQLYLEALIEEEERRNRYW